MTSGLRFNAVLAAALLCSASTAEATPSAEGSFVKVSADGRTRLTRILGGARVSFEIAGHSLPVGHRAGQDHLADVRCSGGRNPCMLADSLTIRVNGRVVDVPRSIVVALSDVNRAGLSASRLGAYRLILDCGDASESSTMILLFDHKRVKQRDVIDNEAGMLAERTAYRDLSHAFKN